MSSLRTRSFRNIKSEENVANYSMLFHKESRVFEEFVPAACRDYDSLYFVFVKKEIIQEDAYLKFYEMDSKAKRLGKKRSMMPTAANNNSDEIELNVPNSALEQALEDRNSADAGAVIFTARYDTLDHLREIYMDRIPVIDNTTITVIRLVSSQYTYLRKITIKRSGINANTIYQVNKMLQTTNITEVSLDDLRLAEANYYILLDRASALKSLSLCRSNINDTVVQELCVRLSYLRPAETHLALLDLTSNDITDVGAAYISRTLRSNRHLQYLNLSGNKITDEGACSIFESLMEFPLTVQELFEKRQRLFKFNMKRRATIMGKAFPKATDVTKMKDSKAGSTKGAKIKKKKVNSKTSSNEFAMSFVSDNRPIGSLQDPFNVKYMRIINNRSYCMGNFTLVMLNLGYNHLTYLGIKKLAEVIAYQSKNKLKEGGLHRVVVDGNYLPTDCPEYVEIDHVLG